MKIPYSDASFAGIRRGGYFYADKTLFLPRLESAEAGGKHLVFLRPRRFGKSTLISTLEGTLVERFSARELYHKDHFVTLLHCMGLLTIEGSNRGSLRFRVPNLVSARMHWEGLAIMASRLDLDAIMSYARLEWSLWRVVPVTSRRQKSSPKRSYAWALPSWQSPGIGVGPSRMNRS